MSHRPVIASLATRQAAVMLAQQQQLQQQQQYDIQRLSIASSASMQSSDTPTLQPAYQPLAQQHMSRPGVPAVISDGYRETLAEISSAIRHDVDQFLVALPLGTSPDDAAVEEAVASKLYEALLSKAVMQHKLTDW